MPTPRYVDANYMLAIGDYAFLVECLNTNNATTRWVLRETPQRTNQSREPRLEDWCGETDNVSRYARGLVKVTGETKNGDRQRIAQVHGAELATALEALGYPELIP